MGKGNWHATFPDRQQSPTGPNPLTLSAQNTCPSTASTSAGGMQNSLLRLPIWRIEQGLVLHERVSETPGTLLVTICLILRKSNHLSQKRWKSVIISLK